MINEIKKELKRLEEEKNIKVLYAVESGSRAWGFASPDSDWDVRFIYIHKAAWYLDIDQGKDNYNKILDNDIDLSGWELQKTLRLFRKSNPPLLEWLNSPIVYIKNEEFVADMKGLLTDYFNPKSCMYHYLSIAKRTFNVYLKAESLKLKKYFYAIRPIFAAKWIKTTGTLPPVEFQPMYENTVMPDYIRAEIDQLLIQKKKAKETSNSAQISVLNQYLESEIATIDNYLKQYKTTINRDSKALNDLFLKYLKQE